MPLWRFPTFSIALSLGLLLVTVGCIFGPTATNGNLLASQTPRWSCPTPEALPTIQVADGSKDNDLGTPEPQFRNTEPYEREYGRPVVRPTVYARSGEDFFIGQIINLAGGVDIQIEVENGQHTSDLPPQVLSMLTLTWHNSGPPFIFDPARQVVISAVKRPDGRLMGGTWNWTPAAAAVAGTPSEATLLRRQIEAGETTIVLPILIPEGTVQVADLRLDPPNAKAETAGSFRVQFSPGNDPKCDKDGTVGATYAQAGQPSVPLAAPAGTDALVATALAQVGRQYCWGGRGFTPCSGLGVTPACASYPCFDCSGLTFWTYKEHGINILPGTVNQKNYPEVPRDQIQPGDLILFGGINQQGRSARITHVALYAGDVTGDGTADIIHATNYPDGVLITNNVWNSPYYRARVALITRPPR